MAVQQKIPENLQGKFRMLNIKPETLELVSEAMARKYQMIPLGVTGKSGKVLRLAMANPNDIIAIDTLSLHIKMHIDPEAFSAEEIQEAIDFYYGSPKGDSDYESPEEDSDYESSEEIERQVSRIRSLTATSEEQTIIVEETDSPIIRALSLIINDAVRTGASDIHFQPQEHELLVRYRVDGALHEVLSLPANAAKLLATRIKVLANLNIADHRRPQDGQFVVERNQHNGHKVKTDIRVGIVPSSHGETATLRLHDTSKVLMKLSQLGFLPESRALYRDMLQVPHGMILVSGPTGAGKTTTLYASLNSLDCQQRHIITIEDPVEYDFDRITQIQVNVRAGLTFANGLRSILRVDPDVILIGEIRDPETAQIAVQPALTGVLVLSSIHANDAVGVVSRLLDLGIEPFLIASALVGVVSQRMVRKICANCAQEVEGSLPEQIAYADSGNEERSEFPCGAGYELCTSGYRGRTGIFEVMHVSDEIRKIIVTRGSSLQLQAQAIKEGMIPLMNAGMLKVKENITTPSEVLRNAYSIMLTQYRLQMTWTLLTCSQWLCQLLNWCCQQLSSKSWLASKHFAGRPFPPQRSHGTHT